jgi:hypothetical protein
MLSRSHVHEHVTGRGNEPEMSMLLGEVMNQKKTPAIIYEDNLGCIFLIKNQQIGQRTKHIDIRKHFIRELHEGKEGKEDPPSGLLACNQQTSR